MSLDANGKETGYREDPFGNLSKTTDPMGNVVTVKYNAWGQGKAENAWITR
jgi:YD repeat-containing protein